MKASQPKLPILKDEEVEDRIAYKLTNMISEMHFDFSFCKEKDKFVMEKIWQENIVPLPDLQFSCDNKKRIWIASLPTLKIILICPCLEV